MRIGLVTQAYYPVLGGVTEHVWHLGTELQRRGHDVTVITGGVPHRLLQTGVSTDNTRGLRVLRHGWQIPLMSNGANIYMTIGWKMGRWLQHVEAEEKFDVLHIQSPLDPGLPLIASKTMRAKKVATYHSARQMTGAAAEKIPTVFRPVFLDAIQKISKHIAVSPAAVEYVHHFFPQIQLTVIPNGVDTGRFRPADQPAKSIEDPLTILYVGRMDPRKGAKYLFAALPQLEQELSGRFRLVVIGTGWMSKYYDAHIPLQLRKRVELVGYVSPEDLPRYYRSADVYCSPATGNESFGIVLLEAMASGTAVVASDIPGYRDVINSGTEGILVPPRDPAAIATALVSLGKDPARRAKMGTAGRATALKYDWRAVTDQVETVYRSLLS